ncbi:restriction endonuclease subunit S [Escherichia coli]|uniref:restriction endonuclease subunit S n=1 Tax=Escherichia coli TaxID=562 RepID=UPI0016572720|nr:restriction endonuclease subunit S [Escherichia coli]EIM2794224.1 restriction endonuclease subunit S [Escherichia coli]EIM9269442.1 restriction endonuclease subunit S [Escherichia coli]EJN7604266.1 restriction endonuclease subunit S [Escherichia coli]EKN4282172.1 restriction endonuclease subunit S [Escherichia coli]EKR7494721.1 restriction endonuclease subunit S [Escherichia coli]
MAFNYEINQLELMQARIKSVPHGWQFTYVGKAFCIRNNLRKPISEEERSMSPGNYPYYGPTKIQGYIGTFEQDGSYALIGEDGDHFLKFEKHSMTQLVDGKCTVNNHAHIIEGTKEASREWFYYYFMHRDIFSFLSRQGAGRYKLNKASLEKMPLLLPPIVEQKKIAQILSTWDKAISVTEKLLTNSQQQKKALMQQLLTGKKRLLDENGVRFSGEWRNSTLSMFCNIAKGKALSASDLEVGDFPVIAGGKSSPYSHSDYTHENVVTVSASGAYAGYISYHNYKIWASDCSVVSAKADNLIDYFYQLLLSLQDKIYSLQSGGAQPHIYPKDLNSIPLWVPCVKEQQKIAAVLSAADAEISTLEKKLACLRDEKKALMQQLLTGKRRVKVDEAVAE